MKHIIFSDIHGNVEALQKMLEDTAIYAPHEKKYYFCGDVMGYFYQVSESIDLLKKIDGLISIRGNHDQMFLEMQEGKKEPEKLQLKYGKSYLSTLTQTQLEYLKSMRIGYHTMIKGKRFAFFHGTPDDYFNGRYYPDNNTPLKGIDNYDIVILANTHYRLLKTQANKLIINPGSLGLPRDGKGFSYLIYDDCIGEFEYKTIAFNIKKLYQAVIQSDDYSEPKNYLLRRLDEYL